MHLIVLLSSIDEFLLSLDYLLKFVFVQVVYFEKLKIKALGIGNKEEYLEPAGCTHFTKFQILILD